MASGGVDSINLLKLEEENRLVWAIKNHSVIATWREEVDNSNDALLLLGDRTPHNGEESQLRVWLGEDVGHGQLLIVLAIRIRLRSSSKTNPRQMFLVVPSESLRIQCTAPTFEQLSRHDVPHMLIDQPSDKNSADSARVLHIAFSLGHDTSSKVVMPKAESQRPTVGQPLHLLESLKSLSKARKFNVYLNFNTYAQQHLNSLSKRLEEGIMMTPSVDLTSMYAGRGGSVNNWSAQGMFDNDQYISSTCKRRKLVQHTDAITAPDLPPPPYSTRGGQAIIPRSCTPVARLHGSESGSCVPETPIVPPGQALIQTCKDSRLLVDPPLEDSSLPRNDPRLASVPHPVNASFSVQALLSTEGPAAAASGFLPTAEIPLLTVDPRLATTCRSADALPSNPPLPPDVLCQSAPFSRKVCLEMCWWLVKAWTTCPDAHFLFVANLLCMGAAAQEEDNTLYARKRAESTTELLYYNGKIKNKNRSCPNTGMDFLCRNGRRASSTAREEAIKQETARMIRWMNLINPNADLLLLKECLAKWTERGIRLIEFGSDGVDELNGYAVLLRDFNQSKALCVVETCLCFGREALTSVNEIVAGMRKEAT